MKRLSWPGVAVVAGSTVFSWLSGTPGLWPTGHPGAAVEPPAAVERRAPADSGSPGADASALASMRLHDWSARLAEHGERERNIFSFRRSPRLAAPPPAPAPGLLEAKGDARQPPLVPLRLIGVAEDAGPDGTTRTAIISGEGQLYMAKEGDTVAWIYRVGRMSPESVELVDTTGGATLRLTLK